MFLAWMFLIAAILTEVAGTLTMNYSGHSGSLWAYGLMFLFICSSYIFLSFALRQIAVGIAIAIWEGLGTSLVTLISISILHERVSMQKLIGICVAFLGIALLHFGEKEETGEGRVI